MDKIAPLDRYDRMCDRAAAEVIRSYSTSFFLATRFLRDRVQTDVRNIYAMVRVADEIVDGVVSQAQGDPAEHLETYCRQVSRAKDRRFHTDPIVHAWANSARHCNFNDDHVSAFFDSMRRDLTQSTYNASDFDAYVYGSAEVIGLMCVDAFVADNPVSKADRQQMEVGARALGAAFQKVNFLRDLSEDQNELGRSYFPQLNDEVIDDATKAELIADIRNDLSAARDAIPLLPPSARGAVAAAEALYSELTELIDATSAASLYTQRVSVPQHRKIYVTARALRRARG